MRGKVYIIQEIFKRSPVTGEMVSVMDFRKALDYGDLEVCLPKGPVSLTPGPTVDILKNKLRNFSDNDHIVAVGDPSAIMIAGAIAAERNAGKFKLLKWDRDSKQYICVSVDIFNRKSKED